jgi:hypothetical protein
VPILPATTVLPGSAVEKRQHAVAGYVTCIALPVKRSVGAI